MFADNPGPARLGTRLWRVVWAFILISVLCSSCRQRPAVRPTGQMNVAQRFWIRVLLFDDVTDCTLQVPASFAVTTEQRQAEKVYFQEMTGPTPAKVCVSDGEITLAGETFDDSQITVLPDWPFVFKVNQRDYRGNLRLILNEDGSSFDVINVVPLEAYLAGVVGAEMPNYWEPEALKAQAVAARTYCLYIKKRFGAKRNFDVLSTQASQVYMGIAAESPQVWEAVDKTAGQVLLCRYDNGGDELFPAYYSSTCAGHTENSKNVFGDSFAPLVGVACPYCKDVAKTSLFFWPMAQFDKSLVSSRILRRYPSLKNLGRVVGIEPAAASDYSDYYDVPGADRLALETRPRGADDEKASGPPAAGRFSRLTSIKLTGPSGKPAFLRAEDLRLTIDPTGRILKSTICQIADFGNKWAFVSGRGYGHGVGMCQCGAQGMARKGKTAGQILSHYYPDSRITRVY